jgi:tetratricopeptide (TPR) repeat protein
MPNYYFESSEFKRLLSEYQNALELNVSRYFDVDEFIDLADYYADNVNMDTAKSVLVDGLRLHPDSDRLKIMLAGLHMCMHDYKMANDILNTLENPLLCNDYYYVSAQIQLAVHSDANEAEILFRKWLRREDKEFRKDYSSSSQTDIDEVNEFRRDNYMHILTSIGEFVTDDIMRIEQLKKWVGEYIKKFGSLSNFGRSDIDHSVANICRIENFPALCEDIYTMMLQNEPYLENGWAILAASQYTNGKYIESVDSAEYALAVNPEDYFSLFTKAHALYALGNIEEALVNFIKFKGYGNESSDLFIASCLIKLERYDDAKPYLFAAENWNENVVAADQPDYFANNCYEMAENYLLLGNPQKALQMADKALKINPLFFDYQQVKGAALIAIGEKMKAFKVFYKSITNYHDRPYAILLTGLRYLNASEFETSIRFFLLTLEEETPPLHAYAYLTYAYYQIGDTVNFLDFLRKSVEKCPEFLREIIGHNFPGVEPSDYYSYIVNLLGNNKNDND